MGIYEQQDEVIRRVVTEVEKVRGLIIAPQIVDELVRVAFWVSLEFNEHNPCRFRLGLVEPDDALPILRLEREVPLTVESIRALAAGTQRSAIIGIRQVGEELLVWGVAHLETDCRLRIGCVGPGRLRVTVFGQPFLVLEPSGAHLVPEGLASAIFSTLELSAHQRVQVDASIRRILAGMIERGRGGTLVVLAPGTDLAQVPISGWVVRAQQPSTTIPDLHALLRPPHAFSSEFAASAQRSTQVNLEQAERTAGALSEIDGALIFAWDLALFGAGAKLAALAEPKQIIEHLGSYKPRQILIEHLGGTRHQSVARFVGAVQNAFGLVVSEDDPVTMFKYDTQAAAVVALRRLDWVLS